jgi:GTP-binding protein
MFATQASSNPPHFIIFCNRAELVHFSYERYLENSLRRALVLKGTPIKLTFKSRDDGQVGRK